MWYCLETSYFACYKYVLNGPVVKVLEIKADDLSSNLMRTFQKSVCLVIAYYSMIQVLINPHIPPPQLLLEKSQGKAVEISSPRKLKEGSTICL